jgi:hypothetical protein
MKIRIPEVESYFATRIVGYHMRALNSDAFAAAADDVEGWPSRLQIAMVYLCFCPNRYQFRMLSNLSRTMELAVLARQT